MTIPNNNLTLGNLSTNTATIYTTSGYSGTSGSIYLSDNSAWTASPLTVEQSGSISITGKEADISINGKSMRTWMEHIETRLAILSPNPELEKEWEELKELGNRYRELEKELIEKAKTWEILKRE